jgi:hypothetical protein
MASVIRIKRRKTGATGAPASLKGGELAYNEVGDALYYGKGEDASGNATSIVKIGGVSLDYVTIATAETVTGDKTFSGAVDLTGAFKLGGVAVTSDAAELNKLDGVVAGTASASKALVVDANKDLTLDGGDLTVADFTATGSVTIGGDLTVNGTTTTINSTIVSVDDKAIELGSTASPSDASANGGGIILKGTTDKTILFASGTSSWDVSEHVNVASGKEFKIGGTSVLSGSALGSGVTGSSLTSVGTISSGTWQGTAVAIAYGGTGATTAADARTNLGLVIGTDVQAYDAELAAIAGLTSAADKGIYFTGSGAAATFDLSSFGRTLAGAADASAARTSLELGSMALQSSSSVAITGGSIDGVTLDGGSY